MSCSSLDLTIDGALADPMIAVAMRADHVDPREFEILLRTAARERHGSRATAGLPSPEFPVAALADRASAMLAGLCHRW